jgi:hypothetical protein
MIKNFTEWLFEAGLWDNIRAKRARGEKPARKGSKAYKRAVHAAKEIREDAQVNKRERADRVGRALVRALQANKIERAGYDPVVEFEDWWCVTGRDYDEGDVAYLESLENTERRKPLTSRLVSDIWMFEFKIRKNSTHWYRLASLDTRNYKLNINAELDNLYGDRFRKIYQEVLEKEFPEEAKGQRYGV